MIASLRSVLCLLFLLAATAGAQEFDCVVTTGNLENLSSEARENLADFVIQVKEYINSYRWTREDFGADKIKCTIQISFSGSKDNNHYIAGAFIGSQRPIYRDNRNTPVLRLLDESWEFDYVRSQPLTHDEYKFDPLLSFLDFYMYLMIGYDYDTFENSGVRGTANLQKALDIVNKARGAIGAGKGWESSSQNVYSRGGLIDEILNAKFRALREASYRYHFRGLDLMKTKPVKAKENILAALEGIQSLKQRINQRSLALNIFFDTKYQEIAQTFVDFPDPGVYFKLTQIDPAHQSTYEEYSLKKR